jgi:hypothetical protein
VQDPAEAIVFRPSAESALGVELELQIIDPRTGDLTPAPCAS